MRADEAAPRSLLWDGSFFSLHKVSFTAHLCAASIGMLLKLKLLFALFPSFFFSTPSLFLHQLTEARFLFFGATAA